MPEIKLTDLSFSYSNTSRQALAKINLTIPTGAFVAIVGHTGSGKSTMVSLIDGLIKPSTGQVQIGKTIVDASAKRASLAKLRQHVGLVFQFPEQQLFAETVAKDIAFGPENLGWSDEKIKDAVQTALKEVGLPAEIAERSPFMLSGGQMRRVAIAGVLAMNPEVLILDEPTAGLDARSTDQLMQLVTHLHAQGRTIILITHQMEQVARYASQVVVMNHGQMVTSTTPAKLFSDHDFLQENHLGEPAAVKIGQQLRARGIKLKPVLTLTDLARQLAPRLGGKYNE